MLNHYAEIEYEIPYLEKPLRLIALIEKREKEAIPKEYLNIKTHGYKCLKKPIRYRFYDEEVFEDGTYVCSNYSKWKRF